MFPIFAAIGAALAAAAVPVAKAVALGAAGGAAAFGTTKALEAVTKGKPTKSKVDDTAPKPQAPANAGPKPALAIADPKAEAQEPTPPVTTTKAIASLTPAWSALQNPVPEHLRVAEPAANKTTASDTLPLAPVEPPQTSLPGTPRLTVPEPVLPLAPPASVSPVIRL